MDVKATRFWYGVASSFYDRLRDFVYPSAKALTFDLIQNLPPHKSALCIGGGTGEWLPTYVQLHPKSTLYYVDVSDDMISRAKLRVDRHSISFIQANAKNITLQKKIDLIILPFFLDHFTENEIAQWLIFFQTLSSKNLQIAVVDFKPNSAQTIQTQFLVCIARRVLKLQIKYLADIDAVLKNNELQINWNKESKECFAALYTAQ